MPKVSKIWQAPKPKQPRKSALEKSQEAVKCVPQPPEVEKVPEAPKKVPKTRIIKVVRQEQTEEVAKPQPVPRKRVTRHPLQEEPDPEPEPESESEEELEAPIPPPPPLKRAPRKRAPRKPQQPEPQYYYTEPTTNFIYV